MKLGYVITSKDTNGNRMYVWLVKWIPTKHYQVLILRPGIDDGWCTAFDHANINECKRLIKEVYAPNATKKPEPFHLWEPEPIEQEPREELKEEAKPMKERIFELPCLDSHKSFYGKAWVKECANGERLLQSYNTIVCKIDVQGHFVRLWGRV